ncbi:hypothetical protein ATO12_03580 [Aquimarina atlantica]|uniref:DUF3841 domain-containing protein n=1 Tax=Aquimarina atlantica TaxID=1317122 RepID=A0A023C0Z4_9FLAO|nr:DUF3841 domain-containing protein [Aquimarina atlantica]EZH75884.1 hypothetical protein ATO12_03580 [Aquimarina atlantica]
MKIKLWTIQNEIGWNELNENGVLIPKEEFVESDFKAGYEWMKSQMSNRIGKPEKRTQFPVWAWYQHFDSNKRKPDLRKSGLLPKGTVGYRIEIEKEQKDILLSDFVLWHWPLSYKDYIADSEVEANEFEKKYGNTEYEELSKTEKNLIEKSWEKIFDMNFDLEFYTLPFKEKKIQATFWGLRKEDIIKVDKFIAK